MIIQESRDIGDIKKILCDPLIYEAIGCDGCPDINEFEPPINDSYKYFVGYVKGEAIGVTIYHSYSDGNKCHFQVLKEYRQEYANEFAKRTLLLKGDLPLYVEIPDLHKSALHFSIRHGFKKINVTLNDYMKNGKKYNTNILRLQDGIY